MGGEMTNENGEGRERKGMIPYEMMLRVQPDGALVQQRNARRRVYKSKEHNPNLLREGQRSDVSPSSHV